MKKRIIIKNTLFAIVSALLLLSAVCKFNNRETMTSLFSGVGMQDYMLRIAMIQIIIALCIMWKPLRSLGVLLGSAFLGGMIFMIIVSGNNPLSAGLMLIMLWIAYKLEWWGYWNHYTEQCGCGWCKRHSDEPCNCTETCSCKKGNCNC